MNALQSLATIQFPDVSPRNRLERVLSHLADVRAGEGVGALLLNFNLFLLLAAYYMLKTVREALILTQGGAEVKSYSAAGTVGQQVGYWQVCLFCFPRSRPFSPTQATRAASWRVN